MLRRRNYFGVPANLMEAAVRSLERSSVKGSFEKKEEFQKEVEVRSSHGGGGCPSGVSASEAALSYERRFLVTKQFPSIEDCHSFLSVRPRRAVYAWGVYVSARVYPIHTITG